ncbi:MAG TPA: prepilin-type N-terminal cleavage/methylation domain-containing protein [Candidatus Saccharimonadales bacterium]|nr:prepilin-type N-terminal cleavage/methylation domain-containing protein [Candidatus Saccharimonadales bacterium]
MDKVTRQRLGQNGFHVVELLVALAVVAIIGLIGYRVLGSQKADDGAAPNSRTTNGQEVTWAFNQDKLEWFAQTGTPAECADPFIFDQSPVDLSKLMAIGMPGAYRGYNYKPHGGMRLSDPNSGKIDIVMPTNATLVGLTRYYEGNPAELQYLLTFENDCGIAFRFDHLRTLTPAFQAIAETTPEPKKDDTRTGPNASFKRTKFKAGDRIATEIGFASTKNFGFDFGVYNYRQRNDISKNQAWANIHNQYQSQEWYGTCWIDHLPGTDAAKARELAFVVINPAKPNIISDYCAYAPHRTLDFNKGRPTDG